MGVCESCLLTSNSLGPHGLCILQARILKQLAHSILQGIFPTQGLNPGLPHCRQILYQLSHEERKPKNTGVGSLSILQWIFLTQESNQGLLHCRLILYQLSIQGSPLNEEVYTQNLAQKWAFTKWSICDGQYPLDEGEMKSSVHLLILDRSAQCLHHLAGLQDRVWHLEKLWAKLDYFLIPLAHSVCMCAQSLQSCPTL